MRLSSSTFVAGTCLLAGALAVAWLRPRLAERFHQLRTTSDVYALPSPEQAVVASLGYRAAVADMLYAHVLVSYGLHFKERRRFEFVGNYLETINALDPKFRAPYRFADTLLTLQPEAPRFDDYRKARAILERGMAELPHDSELWLTAGQYVAYLAPAHLKNPREKAEWKRAGARMLARACELIGSNENLPYHCITAATILNRQGSREALIQFLERVLAVSDNEEIRNMALGYLKQAVGQQERERAERRLKDFRDAWQRDLPFISKDMMLVIGPASDPSDCAGLDRAHQSGCASTWRVWAEQLEAEVRQ